MTVNKAQFIQEIADILEMDSSELKLNSELSALGTWDSLALISTIALFNREFGIVLQIEDLEKVHTVNDLLELAKTHLTH